MLEYLECIVKVILDKSVCHMHKCKFQNADRLVWDANSSFFNFSCKCKQERWNYIWEREKLPVTYWIAVHKHLVVVDLWMESQCQMQPPSVCPSVMPLLERHAPLLLVELCLLEGKIWGSVCFRNETNAWAWMLIFSAGIYRRFYRNK